jgi:hypothetical protein
MITQNLHSEYTRPFRPITCLCIQCPPLLINQILSLYKHDRLFNSPCWNTWRKFPTPGFSSVWNRTNRNLNFNFWKGFWRNFNCKNSRCRILYPLRKGIMKFVKGCGPFITIEIKIWELILVTKKFKLFCSNLK